MSNIYGDSILTDSQMAEFVQASSDIAEAAAFKGLENAGGTLQERQQVALDAWAESVKKLESLSEQYAASAEQAGDVKRASLYRSFENSYKAMGNQLAELGPNIDPYTHFGDVLRGCLQKSYTTSCETKHTLRRHSQWPSADDR